MRKGRAYITYYLMNEKDKQSIELPIILEEDISYDNVYNIALEALHEDGIQGIVTHVILANTQGQFLVEHKYD